MNKKQFSSRLNLKRSLFFTKANLLLLDHFGVFSSITFEIMKFLVQQTTVVHA